jgi:ABC-type transport system substrate-binding protein
MKRKLTSLLLLALLGMACLQACAQNQTPANAAPVGWTDPATGLTWTKADNGSDVNWNQATDYCSSLRLGGYSDWRLPTIDELKGIYDANAGDSHVKGNLKLYAGFLWSSTQKNAGQVWLYAFGTGQPFFYRLSDSDRDRALCVRR